MFDTLNVSQSKGTKLIGTFVVRSRKERTEFTGLADIPVMITATKDTCRAILCFDPTRTLPSSICNQRGDLLYPVNIIGAENRTIEGFLPESALQRMQEDITPKFGVGESISSPSGEKTLKILEILDIRDMQGRTCYLVRKADELTDRRQKVVAETNLLNWKKE